jgi:meso-butanediol dehydrogenase/(S,S)-butanediol dehydrogenase/diacetyl reductase
MSSSTDKVAIVTGAGTGIGAATALRFIADGGRVTMTGRRRDKLAAASAELDPERVLLWPGDVSDAADVEAMVVATMARFGRIDTLVNNAGTATFGPFLHTPTEEWQRVLRVNVDGIIYASRAALPHLLVSRGSIVNVSSVSGIGGDWGLAYYNTSKGAVNNLTRALALEFGSQGVRVNAVAPSITRTDMAEMIVSNEALMKRFADRLPLGRAAEASEIASVIAFLAGPDASFVNGVILPVDGGIGASNGQPNMAG